jgi:hypothetical protein
LSLNPVNCRYKVDKGDKQHKDFKEFKHFKIPNKHQNIYFKRPYLPRTRSKSFNNDYITEGKSKWAGINQPIKSLVLLNKKIV